MVAAFAAGLLLTSPVSAAAPSTAPTPAKKPGEKVDFERHIMGLLGRLGCNSGSCHGSFQGKGGFRLSLFGYDPEFDYQALTREGQGRRINPVDPDSSLLLLKASGAVEHGGARRFGKDSEAYATIRQWIVGGMSRDKGSGTIQSVNVTPSEQAFTRSGETGQLKVEATFADGSKEDITLLSDYRTNDEAVATVTPGGVVSGKRPGDTAIIVTYRGQVLPVRVLVPMTPPAGFKYTKVPEVNYIDREVFAKLKRLNIQPSDLAGDAEFLRRVSIDTIGSLPTPDEVREFVADKDPNKREKKIDELLKHPLHAALWATKFSDITGNNTDSLENPVNLKPRLSQMWHDWFRRRVQENMPYDEIVKGVLTATTREGREIKEFVDAEVKLKEQLNEGFVSDYSRRDTLDLFWRRQQRVTIDQWGEKTAVAFMGVRVECAQCHKHPFDRWTQVDYRSYANLFAPINVGISPDSRKAIADAQAEIQKKNEGKNRNQIPQIRELFVDANIANRGLLTHPETNAALTPKALGGPEIKFEAGKDPRLALYEWLRSPDNPYFSRSFVNRVWGHYFGIGIVHPVDDFSLANPPSNDKLLDALARDFIDNKFDLRKLEKTILMSRTYQLSSTANATNKQDNSNYSKSYVRPVMAEVVVDVINTALGVTESFGQDAPNGAKAIEVGSTRIQNPALREAFRVWGRSPRTMACDCERATEATVANKLYLIADPTLQQKFRDPRNCVKEVLAKCKTDDMLVEELFLRTLSRLPTEKEREKSLGYLSKERDRAVAASDILWALINTTEFVHNH
jgi:hypothetical protein